MNKEVLLNGVSNALSRCKFFLTKNGPQLFVAGGVVGVVASGVLACIATRKVDDVVEKTKEEITAIHEAAGDDEYTTQTKKELCVAYVKAGLAFAQLYLPAVGLGALSITSILYSHNMLSKRNAALAAAYTVADTSLKEYRARVVERYGETVDHELRYGVQTEKLEETVTDENSKTKKVKKNVQVANINEEYDYARYFDQRSTLAWTTGENYNLTFLHAQQNLANDILTRDGYMFLNDVYAMLGYERTVAGQVVGWTYDKNGVGDESSDNHIDFRIQKTYRKNEDGELVPTIMIDPNVEGSILTKIKEKGLICA